MDLTEIPNNSLFKHESFDNLFFKKNGKHYSFEHESYSWETREIDGDGFIILTVEDDFFKKYLQATILWNTKELKHKSQEMLELNDRLEFLKRKRHLLNEDPLNESLFSE